MTEVASRATSAAPCQVCGSPSKNCSATIDGAHWCRGEPRPGWKCVKKGDTFNTYRRESDTTNLRNRTPDMPAPSKQPRLAEAKPKQNWGVVLQDRIAKCGDAERAELGRALGLPVAALDALPIGWRSDKHGAHWLFPEYNAAGKVIGLARRYAKPVNVAGKPQNKMNLGPRGLTIPWTWTASDTAPVFVVEGLSDVLALSLCGLSVIGRPSNNGGVGHLRELLAPCSHRDVYVVGENDRKEDGNWPGRDGARTVAKKLTTALGRPVCWSMPPPEYKDARVWVQAIAAGFGEAEDWHVAGREIATWLVQNATRTAPPASMAEEPTAPAPPQEQLMPRFNFIRSGTFASGDYRPEWLVTRALVRRQPGVIAGPSKALKTNLSIDLAVSLAAGSPFLGKFDVPRPVRVAVVSGESGEHTLQETAHRVCKAKGQDLASLDANLAWCFSLPTFSDIGVMGEFAETLAGLNAEVVIIDPVYLALGNIDAKNLFEAGAAFRVVAEVLLKAGCTPVLVHHANRQLVVGEPMELTHLAYSGLEQFARQFVLLNRRVKYKGDGTHDLWATIGGSAGHGGSWSLHIEEGTVDENFAGREWNVTVQSRGEVLGEDIEQRHAAKREANRKKRQAEETAVLLAIDAEVKGGQPAATETAIRARSHYGQCKVKQIIADLLETGHVIEAAIEKAIGNGAKRRTTGYKRADNEHR